MYITDVQLAERLGVLFDEKYMVNWTRCCEMYITEVHLLKCIKGTIQMYIVHKVEGTFQ